MPEWNDPFIEVWPYDESPQRVLALMWYSMGWRASRHAAQQLTEADGARPPHSNMQCACGHPFGINTAGNCMKCGRPAA